MNFRNDGLFPCAYKHIFNIDCPICGFQRAFILLIDGNFVGSLYMYLPLIPILIFLMLCFIDVIAPSKFIKKIINQFGIIVLSIICVNYIIKIFIHLIK
jgi:hypothetical protein